ncbi:MAG: PDZ domain-containing protein [Planctomycetes bacterium]|nr:PDZ domain-containing protein [Planctomycetota bacterium]
MPRSLLLLALLLAPAAAQSAPPLTGRQQLRDTPVARVVREAGPAVVNVYQDVVHEVELRYPYNLIFPSRSRRSSLGTGFVIDRDGYILTNAHVIQQDQGVPVSQGIYVRLSDRSEYPAELVNVDVANDVALLKVTPPPGLVLAAARLGTSSDVMPGESVVAIGNPLGNENSVSTGIVSSVFREVPLPASGRQPSSPVFKDYIQVDAAINPGNSGGPLLNVLGEVIGINFAIANNAEGIGFAIPIDRVRRTLTENLLNPRIKREVVTGLEVQGDPVSRSVILAAVHEDGPAERAGLRAGDQLVSIAGQPVAWEFDVSKALLATQPGDRVDVVVERDGRTVRAALELGRDDSPLLVIWRRMGLSVVDHPRYKGVRVERVDPTGPAAVLGLQPGDLLDGLGEEELDSTLDLHDTLRALPPGQRMVVHVWRGNGASWGQMRLQ